MHHARDVASQAYDGLRVDLTNARFGKPKYLRDFRQAHVLKVIHSQNLARNLRQLIDSLGDQLRDLVLLHFGGYGTTPSSGMISLRSAESESTPPEEDALSRGKKLIGRTSTMS